MSKAPRCVSATGVGDESRMERYEPIANRWMHRQRWLLAFGLSGAQILGIAFFVTLLSSIGNATAQTIDLGFNPNVTLAIDSIKGVALQPDNKILVPFYTYDDIFNPIPHIVRVNEDGSPDATFAMLPSTSSTNQSLRMVLAAQIDGKVLVGSAPEDIAAIGGATGSGLARLSADGSVDTTFNSQICAGFAVTLLAAQPDGKTIAGCQRNFDVVIARVNADGTADGGYNAPSISGSLNTLALQQDSKVVIAGQFSSVGGQPSPNPSVLRLNTDGSLDSTFNLPGGVAGDNPLALVVQPDGKILLAGYFPDLSTRGIVRLNSDGTLDTTFASASDNPEIWTVALQADGKILVAGSFTTFNGQPRNRIARLNPDGSLDASFDLAGGPPPGYPNRILGLAAQADGKILISGGFTSLGESPAYMLARVTNPDVAQQTLNVPPAGTEIDWLRNGAGPEFERVSFDVSTDDMSWSSLGEGEPIVGGGGWSLSIILPANRDIWVRARGYVQSGIQNGFGSLHESVVQVHIDNPNGPFEVTPSAGLNGTINPDIPQTANFGDRIVFALIPDAGYVASISGTCGGTLSADGNTYTTLPVTADCAVEANFVHLWTVTPNAGPGGTIAPAAPQIVESGTAISFTITPDAGYGIASVTGCGGILKGNTYTTASVTTDCSVTAAFVMGVQTVTPIAGPDGTIDPNTPQTVNFGDAVSFAVTASPNHHAIVAGTCGGTLEGTNYTTNPVTADCTVEASFPIDTYQVTASAGSGGTISPPFATVNFGAAVTFTVTPNAGSAIGAIGGTCGGQLIDNTYTTNPITSDCTVEASFTAIAYVVTPSAGAHGAISPAAPQTVDFGDTQTFTITADDGYVANVGGTCGGSLINGTVYTTAPIDRDCTVIATFTERVDSIFDDGFDGLSRGGFPAVRISREFSTP